jgi:hypothetical protein
VNTPSGIMFQASTTLFDKKFLLMFLQIRKFKYIVQSLLSDAWGRRIFSEKQQSLNKQTDHLPELHILMLRVYRGSQGEAKIFQKNKNKLTRLRRPRNKLEKIVNVF